MIPHELTNIPQWVLWRYENDTKVPYTITGAKASSTNPATWNTYQAVVNAMQSNQFSGIGFVLSAQLNMTLIDLDDPAGDPIISERHNRLIKMMESYTEWSPSGKGMHVIVKGSVPSGSHRDKMGLFSTARFMCMTGNTVWNLPITDRQDLLTPLSAEVQAPQILQRVIDQPEKYSDYEVYERMMNAENGDKVMRTWNGDWEGLYVSHSECDQALVNYLQFYSHNQIQIERMFYASPCAHRLVTGQKHKWPKYMQYMIRKAFDRDLPDIDITALTIAVAKQVQAAENKLVITPKPKPLDWEMPPGLLGEITTYIYAQAPLPVAEVALGGALALMAGICGRAYNVSDEGLNLYLLVLAKTGTGKEAAAKGIGKLMTKIIEKAPAATQFRGPAEIASGPALTKFMSKDSPCCFSVLGEIGLRLHQMCNDQAQSHMIGLRRVLLDLFHKSGKGASLQPHIYSDKDKNTLELHSPSYTLLGEGTPTTFYRYLDESMLSDGLLPRFTMLEYTGDRVDLSETFQTVEIPEGLITRLSELATFCIQMHHSNRVLPCQFTPDATELYKTLAKHFTRKINEANGGNDEVAVQLYNRAHLKIMKLAALIAVGCNPINPTITVDNIEWGRKLIERDIQNVLHRFQVGKVGRETGDLNQIEELSKLIREYLQRPFDNTMLKYKVPPLMKTAGIIPYQYIQRQLASRSSFSQDRVGSTLSINKALQALVYEGSIKEVKSHVLMEQFGSAMKAYAVIDPTAFTS